MDHRERAARSHSDLLGIDGRIFGCKLLGWLALLLSGLALMHQTSHGAIAAGVVLTALAIAHGIELQHQALHGTGFRTRRFNDIAGVLLGLPLLISYSQYRDRHLHHHRHVGTPQDEEFFQFRAARGASLARRLVELLMLAHWWRVACRIGAAVVDTAGRRPMPSRLARRSSHEHLLFLAWVTGLIGSAALGWLSIWPWLLVALACAAVVHTLIEWPEHAGCEFLPDPYRNTRTIRSNRLMTWFTNGNNYHVEHHLLPSVPPERLAELHRRIAPRLKFCDASYGAFVIGRLRGKSRARRTPEVA